MDFEPEKIHAALVQIGLPSSLKDLKNPTEEYVKNLLAHFLNQVGVDFNAIKKMTPEQQSTIFLAEDNEEIIGLVNISEAMAGISNQLFFKDFYLTDLTSPMSKRTRRLATVLTNFMLYASQKLKVIEERLDVVKSKHEQLENLREQRKSLIDMKNQKALENAKKLEIKEQLEREIAKIKELRSERNFQVAAVDDRLKTLENEKFKAAQHHSNLTNELNTMRKKTEDMQMKVVRSPDRIKSHLRAVNEDKNKLTEKRELIQQNIRTRKPAIEKFESCLSLVRNGHAKCPEVKEFNARLIKMRKLLEETTKKVAEVKSIIENESTIPSQENGPVNNALLQKTREHCDQQLTLIRNELIELQNEKKSMEVNLDDAQSRQQEVYSKRDKIRDLIKQTENEYKEFVANCQELYDKEINQEIELKNAFEKNGGFLGGSLKDA